jgi:23S rRNA pseudouridine2605 synthase
MSKNDSSNQSIRLQKFIADCGYTSRRKAELLITNGDVTVNGRMVTELGTKVNPNADVVMVSNQILELGLVDKMYVVLNKPRAYVCTLSDPEGRRTILDLTKDINERIYPVGRLDYLSEGVLILTNDGEFANSIIHPKHGVEKIYEVKVFGDVNLELLKELKKPRVVEGEKLTPKSVRVIKQLQNKTWLEIRLVEGKNREIRKICDDVGIVVDKLRRLAIGGLTCEGIAPGHYRVMKKKEMLKLIHQTSDASESTSETKTAFWSAKKSVKLDPKKARRTAKTKYLATDEAYQMYKKENYYKTLQNIKEKKLLEPVVLEVKPVMRRNSNKSAGKPTKPFKAPRKKESGSTNYRKR